MQLLKFIFLSSVFISSTAVWASSVDSQQAHEVQIRLYANKVAQLMSSMAKINSLQIDTPDSELENARKEMSDIRLKIYELVSETKKYSNANYENSRIRANKKVRKFLTKVADKPFLNAFIAGIGTLALMGYLGYDYGAHRNSSFLYQIIGDSLQNYNIYPIDSFIGGSTGLLAGFFPTLFVTSYIGSKSKSMAVTLRSEALTKEIQKLAQDAGLEVFFKELRANGIAVPENNREQWLDHTLKNITYDVFVPNSPDLVAFQIAHLRHVIEAGAAGLDNYPAQQAVLHGLAEALPATKNKTLKRRLSPQAWADEAHLRFIQTRNRLLELNSKLNFKSLGFDLEKTLQEASNEMRAKVASSNVQHLFRPIDVETKLWLEQAGDEFVTPNMVELYRSSYSPISIKVETKILERPDEIMPIGLGQLNVEIGSEMDSMPQRITITFATSKTKVNEIIAEGAWKESLSLELETGLEKIISTSATRARVAKCQGILTETTTNTKESKYSHEFAEEEIVATESAQLKQQKD